MPDEALPGTVETTWQFFEQIYVYRYLSSGGGSGGGGARGQPRIRYGTEVRSTRAHLRTADSLRVNMVGFWTWNSADAAMRNAVFEWAPQAQ